MAKILVDLDEIGQVLRKLDYINQKVMKFYNQFCKLEDYTAGSADRLKKENGIDKMIQEIDLELRQECQDMSDLTDILDTIMLFYKHVK